MEDKEGPVKLADKTKVNVLANGVFKIWFLLDIRRNNQ